MASHNQGSRTFLAVVLGGIVIAFLIAAYIMSGDHSETSVDMHESATEQPAASNVEVPAEEIPTQDVSPPDEMSDEAMDDAMPGDGMMDDTSPPDEMPGETTDETMQ